MATPATVVVHGALSPTLLAEEVRFRNPIPLRYSSGPDVILPFTQEVPVAADGTFTTTVYGTNDPSWSPTNWTYEVQILGDNVFQRFWTSVPYNAGSINFSALLPVAPISLGTLYAAFNHGSHVLVLAVGAPIPPGTPANTVIVRT
jgi:hypothetical protein